MYYENILLTKHLYSVLCGRERIFRAMLHTRGQNGLDKNNKNAKIMIVARNQSKLSTPVDRLILDRSPIKAYKFSI